MYISSFLVLLIKYRLMYLFITVLPACTQDEVAVRASFNTLFSDRCHHIASMCTSISRVGEKLRMRTGVPTRLEWVGPAAGDHLPYQGSHKQNGREDSGLANLYCTGDSAVWLCRHHQGHSSYQL